LESDRPSAWPRALPSRICTPAPIHTEARKSNEPMRHRHTGTGPGRTRPDPRGDGSHEAVRCRSLRVEPQRHERWPARPRAEAKRKNARRGAAQAHSQCACRDLLSGTCRLPRGVEIPAIRISWPERVRCKSHRRPYKPACWLAAPRARCRGLRHERTARSAPRPGSGSNSQSHPPRACFNPSGFPLLPWNSADTPRRPSAAEPSGAARGRI